MSISDKLFHGLFHLHTAQNGVTSVLPSNESPAIIPCPSTGRPLKVSELDARAQAICPKCSCAGLGGYVSFVGEVRMAYACPGCRELVWLVGL